MSDMSRREFGGFMGALAGWAAGVRKLNQKAIPAEVPTPTPAMRPYLTDPVLSDFGTYPTIAYAEKKSVVGYGKWQNLGIVESAQMEKHRSNIRVDNLTLHVTGDWEDDGQSSALRDGNLLGG